MINVLTEICKRIWRTEERASPLNLLRIITHLIKGNLHSADLSDLPFIRAKLCCRVISNRLKPKAKETIVDLQP